MLPDSHGRQEEGEEEDREEEGEMDEEGEAEEEEKGPRKGTEGYSKQSESTRQRVFQGSVWPFPAQVQGSSPLSSKFPCLMVITWQWSVQCVFFGKD